MFFKTLTLLTATLIISASSVTANAQAVIPEPESQDDEQIEILKISGDESAELPDSIFAPDGRRWEDIPEYEAIGFELDTLVPLPQLPPEFFLPAVYTRYEFLDTVGLWDPMFSGRSDLRWLEEYDIVDRQMKLMQQSLFFNHPGAVRYNLEKLPHVPKMYKTTIDPDNHRIQIREELAKPIEETKLEAEEVKRRHWIRTFNASLQFSQAYVSPNWYQGGNNNLNVLGQIYYNVKLNEQFHPNLLFDFTSQYKLGMNSAPDDSLRNYSISDDLLQLNLNMGLKAVKRWYYSFTGQFKTQLLNSYTSNTRNLRSAFLSPGVLNLGVGMTYKYTNAKKTFSFDASLPLIAYNLKICTNERLNETQFGIKEGHKTISSYGSTVELKLFWKISSNISYNTRLFAFTDYTRLQSDWENTLVFEINKFLTTQIYAHLRYDTHGIQVDESKWKKLQLKEILSIGFSYKFSNL